MNFDEQGHLVCRPKQLYDMAVANPHRLLTGYLMVGTPWASRNTLAIATSWKPFRNEPASTSKTSTSEEVARSVSASLRKSIKFGSRWESNRI